MEKDTNSNRRKFIKKSIILGTALVSAPLISCAQTTSTKYSKSIYLIGPQDGYSPQIGTLLSTMTMMREWVVGTVKDLTIKQLDFQLDDQSNSIGAMLLHLAATERHYQLNTFDGIEWGKWSKEIKNEWGVASGLGEPARKEIKGNNIDYYLSILEEVRDKTKVEFALRNDDWLMESEPFFAKEPTNNYCKWFHVCEHESNHRGQMKLIKKRIPA